jgi:hypothetical protein
MGEAMRRLAPALAPLLVIAVLLALPGGAAAAQPITAPPATPQQVASCAVRAAEHAETAHVERTVSGIGTLGGCIADASGIAHMFIDWERADGRARGRICVDPPVRRGAWACRWDTTALEPGSYVVRMRAVDPAGNSGSSEQAYRVEAAPTLLDPEPSPREGTAEPEPTAPAPQGPAVEVPAPDLPVDPTPQLERPDESAPPVAPPVALPLAQLVADTVAECAQLELAPGVVADRALSVAVLDCMEPSLTALGVVESTLDEIPVPPAIVALLPDAAAVVAADEILPDTIGGVELRLEVAPEAGAEATLAPATPLPA